MKRFFCVILCVLMVGVLCSCQKTANAPSQNGAGSLSSAEEGTATSSQAPAESEKSQSSVSSAALQSSAVSSATKSESKTESKKESKPKETTVTTSAPAKPKFPQFSYTVTDPENKRGLSTQRKGFSFGVAKDGVAHEQSFLNQRTFDGFENVQALALDTKTQEKIMYLTFDNGYEYKNLTADILDTLKEKNVRSAFFITLSYAKQNPKLVQRMIDEGHIVGNHSATHPSFPKLTRTQMAQEIAQLDNYLRANFAYTSPYFRFPSGEHSECALELVSSIGFRSIFWSVAYADWETSDQKGADYAFSTVTSRFHPGAVILLHAVSQDNADALGRMIDEARKQGYQFRSLDQYTY